jgi:hypothetical protein
MTADARQLPTSGNRAARAQLEEGAWGRNLWKASPPLAQPKGLETNYANNSGRHQARSSTCAYFRVALLRIVSLWYADIFVVVTSVASPIPVR